MRGKETSRGIGRIVTALAIAGAIGTLARYSLIGFVQKIDGISNTWGTLIVNLTGCFLAGLMWAIFENKWPVSGETRTLILVGFIGAFTTFSTLILEANELLRSDGWVYATSNIVMQNGLGFLALFIGVSLGRMP